MQKVYKIWEDSNAEDFFINTQFGANIRIGRSAAAQKSRNNCLNIEQFGSKPLRRRLQWIKK